MSNKVILAAVVGSLSCALLLVIALGVTFRLVCLPSGRRSSRHVSPITAIEDQIYAERSAPPPYPEAMATSRPFDDYRREIVAASSDPTVTADTDFDDGDGPGGDHTGVLVRIPADTSDDELLDVDVDGTAPRDLLGADSEDIVITLGCLARWHRGRPKPSSADSSESSVNAAVVESWSPTDAANVVAASGPPTATTTDVGVAADTDTSPAPPSFCDPPDFDQPANADDDDDDDDDRPLLIC